MGIAKPGETWTIYFSRLPANTTVFYRHGKVSKLIACGKSMVFMNTFLISTPNSTMWHCWQKNYVLQLKLTIISCYFSATKRCGWCHGDMSHSGVWTSRHNTPFFQRKVKPSGLSRLSLLQKRLWLVLLSKLCCCPSAWYTFYDSLLHNQKHILCNWPAILWHSLVCSPNLLVCMTKKLNFVQILTNI